ncbi:MAG: hypothetical protein ACOX5Q_04675 [Bacillota bacterium]
MESGVEAQSWSLGVESGIGAGGSLGVGWEWDFDGDLESRAWKGLGWVSLGVDLEVGLGGELESNFEVRLGLGAWKPDLEAMSRSGDGIGA